MRTILNIIWLVLSGFWMALGYALAGIICCILIVTIPFGIASFRMANYALWPFGRVVVDKPTSGAFSLIGNVIWLLV
ncbi:YccF domain-containing protein, partial [Timonella senegalensis]